jgi:hypothetical protein
LIDGSSVTHGQAAKAVERAGERDVAIDLTRSGAPAEVLEMMARVDALNRRLRDSGTELAFSLSADGCSLQIELRDRAGNLLRLLTTDEAARICAEQSVEREGR